MYDENDTFLVRFVATLVGTLVFMSLLAAIRDSPECLVLSAAGFAISYFISCVLIKDYLRG